MDLSLIIGLIVGFGALGTGLILEGGSLGGIVGIPAFIIVVPGSLGVAIVAAALAESRRFPCLCASPFDPSAWTPKKSWVSLFPSPRKLGARGSCL